MAPPEVPRAFSSLKHNTPQPKGWGVFDSTYLSLPGIVSALWFQTIFVRIALWFFLAKKERAAGI